MVTKVKLGVAQPVKQLNRGGGESSMAFFHTVNIEWYLASSCRVIPCFACWLGSFRTHAMTSFILTDVQVTCSHSNYLVGWIGKKKSLSLSDGTP